MEGRLSLREAAAERGLSRQRERLIQTAIREWAYARLYQNSKDRNQNLQPWIHQYNWHRPHASLNQRPPISRSGLDVNNLLRHHS